MLKDYDPYFANFVDDVGYCISLVFRAVELFLGVSYFIGSTIVGSLVWTFKACVIGYNEVTTTAALIIDEIAEFGACFGRALLLIYCGALKVVESFYIAAVDLQSLYFHVTESLSRTVMDTSTFILESVTGIFTKVPQQLIEALSIIGESTIAFKDGVVNVIQDFLLQLVISPLRVLALVIKHTTQLILIPLEIIYYMPPSSILGLFMFIILVFAARRVIRHLVLKNFLALFTFLLSVICKLLSIVRLTRLKNFVSSSVGTISNLRDQRDTSSKVACVICQDKPVSFMSNPCKHVCLCEVCVYSLIEHDNRCPICRGQVTKYDRVFLA